MLIATRSLGFGILATMRWFSFDLKTKVLGHPLLAK